MQSDLLTAKEVAEILRLPLSTVYYLAKTKKIPGVQIGHLWRFPKDAVVRLADCGRPSNSRKHGRDE